jgi:hypothetical protein
MTLGDDSQVDLHRVDAFASEDELTIQKFLQAAPTAPGRVKEQRPSESSLYQRIGHAGGLLWLVNTLYLRVLADPLLMSYFKHLDDQDRQWLRWHMLTLLAVVTGGPSRYRPGPARSPRRSPHHRRGVRPSGLASAGNAPGAGDPAARPAGHPRRGAGTAGCGRDLRGVLLDGSVASGSRRHLSAFRPRGPGDEPPRPQPGPRVAGSPARGPMSCPGGRRVGRTPPIDLLRNASDVAGVTCKQPSTPTAKRGRSGRGVCALALRRRTRSTRRSICGPSGVRLVSGPARAGRARRPRRRARSGRRPAPGWSGRAARSRNHPSKRMAQRTRALRPSLTLPSCSASWKARSASPRSARNRLGCQPTGQ